MKNAGIDMWIVAVKENHTDPLWEDLGRGYVTGVGYYVFFAAAAIASSALALGPCGLSARAVGRLRHVRSGRRRWPTVVQGSATRKRIGVNMSDEIGPADGLHA